MIDNEILDEIAASYAEHEKLNQILEDLKQDINVIYWGERFCEEAFYHNVDLSEALFEYAFEKCEDYRDYKALAFAVGKTGGFDDKEWAKELIDTAVTKVVLLRDLLYLADAVATKNASFYDRGYASALYKEAIEKSKTAYEFYCIAESICQKGMLDDQDWAQDVYQKAIEAAQDADELAYIADSIADEDNLGDEEWAEELYKIAEEFEGTKELD